MVLLTVCNYTFSINLISPKIPSLNKAVMLLPGVVPGTDSVELPG